MTRILIADDHEVVRAGLRRMLESQPNWEVVADVADGKNAISKAVETKPDIAVLDYSLPLVNGIEATRQIRTRLPKTEVLIFTMHDSETLIQDLLKAGARGYLLKTDANHHLISAIEAVASHKPFFTAKISEALLNAFLAGPTRQGSALTNRERGVVLLQPDHAARASRVQGRAVAGLRDPASQRPAPGRRRDSARGSPSAYPPRHRHRSRLARWGRTSAHSSAPP